MNHVRWLHSRKSPTSSTLFKIFFFLYPLVAFAIVGDFKGVHDSLGGVLARVVKKLLLQAGDSSDLDKTRCVNTVWEYFCFILDNKISPAIKNAKEKGKDALGKFKLKNRAKYTIDEYEFGYVAHTHEDFNKLQGHKYSNYVLLSHKIEPFDCTQVHGCRNLDVFFGRGNPGSLLVRDRFCYCSSCREVISKNDLKIYEDDGSLVECAYEELAGEWNEVCIRKKAERGQSRTRAMTNEASTTATSPAELNREYRMNKLEVGSYHFKPLDDDEYTSLTTKFRPQQMAQIATYRICKVLRGPFQTTVSKGKNISIHEIHHGHFIKSTVRKRQWVVLVAWAEVYGARNLKGLKKLQFQLDTENLELVECGDSTAWCLGQPEHPIKVIEFGNSSGRSQLFRIEEESHKMIQTMDSYSA